MKMMSLRRLLRKMIHFFLSSDLADWEKDFLKVQELCSGYLQMLSTSQTIPILQQNPTKRKPMTWHSLTDSPSPCYRWHGHPGWLTNICLMLLSEQSYCFHILSSATALAGSQTLCSKSMFRQMNLTNMFHEYWGWQLWSQDTQPYQSIHTPLSSHLFLHENVLK